MFERTLCGHVSSLDRVATGADLEPHTHVEELFFPLHWRLYPTTEGTR